MVRVGKGVSDDDRLVRLTHNLSLLVEPEQQIQLHVILFKTYLSSPPKMPSCHRSVAQMTIAEKRHVMKNTHSDFNVVGLAK